MTNYTDSFKPQRFCNECAALVVSVHGFPSCLVHGALGSRTHVIEGLELLGTPDGVSREPVRKRTCKTRYRNAEEVTKAVEERRGKP